MAATATATKIRDELLDMEREFWEATKRGDSNALTKMTADNFAFVMPEGVNDFKRDDFVGMMTGGDFKLTSYEFDSAEALVRELGDDAAFLAYHVKWTYVREGKTEKADTYYTSLWARQGGNWKHMAACESPKKVAKS